MPRLQVAVPGGAPPNALLRVRCPDGTEVNVRVPEGLSPGDEFQFEVTAVGEVVPGSSVLPPPAASSTTKSSGSSVRKRHGKNQQQSKQQSQPSSTSSSSSKNGNNNLQRIDTFRLSHLYKNYYRPLFMEHQLQEQERRQRQQQQRNQPQRGGGGQQYMGFLDREIVSGKDFLTALAVGMFIGVCIVLGFLAGVLAVTPIE